MYHHPGSSFLKYHTGAPAPQPLVKINLLVLLTYPRNSTPTAPATGLLLVIYSRTQCQVRKLETGRFSFSPSICAILSTQRKPDVENQF